MSLNLDRNLATGSGQGVLWVPLMGMEKNSGLRFEQMRRAIVFVLLIWWATAVAFATQAENQPVYVYLYSQISDHVNKEVSEDRIRRTLANLERLYEGFPGYGVSAALQFSGAAAHVLDERASNGMKERILRAARAGYVELGYDGSDEPTHYRRVSTAPEILAAKTAAERWQAGGTTAERFLTEYKHLLTGEPDPLRSGGLKRMQEVFGEAACISGVRDEIGSISEVIHFLRKHNSVATMPGIPVADPGRKLSGFGGAVVFFGQMMAQQPSNSPELFFQDNVLRISDTSGPNMRVVYSHEGPEELQKVLNQLDRSRPHVVKVLVGHHSMYIRPQYKKGLLDHPAWFAYFHPESPELPAAVFREGTELDEVFAAEEALLSWLTTEFFPANPGSRFVSNAELKRMVRNRVDSEVSREVLKSAAEDLLRKWQPAPGHPPNFAEVERDAFSLADMFQMLANSLAHFDRTGNLPDSVRLTPIYGPLESPEGTGPNVGEVSVADLAKVCSTLAPNLNDQAWAPVPKNMVPGRVTAGGFEVNAAQFLKMMAQAYLSSNADEKIPVRFCYMFSPAGLTLPTTKSTAERPAVWTLKAAPLQVGN